MADQEGETMHIGREIGDEGPDVQRLIKEIAATGADPDWVRECVLVEQDAIAEAAAKASSRTHLRLVRACPPRMIPLPSPRGTGG